MAKNRMQQTDEIGNCIGVLHDVNKKCSYHLGTTQCVVSVEILPTDMQHCRNYLYDKSWTNQSYEVEGLQWAMYNRNVHSTMTRSSRFYCPIGVINKPTTGELSILDITYLYTDDLLWRNFLSPQCRNCSRDHDHAPFREDLSPAGWDLPW